MLEVQFTNKDVDGIGHNIDFHAVIGPGGGSPVLFAEKDETKVARFRMLYPGNKFEYKIIEYLGWRTLCLSLCGGTNSPTYCQWNVRINFGRAKISWDIASGGSRILCDAKWILHRAILCKREIKLKIFNLFSKKMKNHILNIKKK